MTERRTECVPGLAYSHPQEITCSGQTGRRWTASLRIAQQDVQHLAVAFEFLLEPTARQAVGRAGALHDCAVRRGFTAHEKRHANGTVVSHHRDFRRRGTP